MVQWFTKYSNQKLYCICETFSNSSCYSKFQNILVNVYLFWHFSNKYSVFIFVIIFSAWQFQIRGQLHGEWTTVFKQPQQRPCNEKGSRQNQVVSGQVSLSRRQVRTTTLGLQLNLVQLESTTTTTDNQPTASQVDSNGTVVAQYQSTTSEPESVVIDLDNATSSSASNDNYAAYLSIINAVSDLSSDDEELNQALLTSLESHA